MYLSAQVRYFGNGGANMFILTLNHSCFKVGLPPSISFREKQNLVCHWSNIMIKGTVCRTKNRPAIQLCYPAVSCLRQVVNSFLSGRLGQVHMWFPGLRKQISLVEYCSLLVLLIDKYLQGILIIVLIE